MMWSDKSDFSYMKWDIGEPSFEWNGHAEDCLSVKGSGYWNDDHCDTDKHGYLCQIPRAYSGCLGIGNFIAQFQSLKVVFQLQMIPWNAAKEAYQLKENAMCSTVAGIKMLIFNATNQRF